MVHQFTKEKCQAIRRNKILNEDNVDLAGILYNFIIVSRGRKYSRKVLKRLLQSV